MKDLAWQAKVKDALETFSTASSWTCLGPNKERRQVRSLCATLATIHRSVPALSGLAYTQFRHVTHKCMTYNPSNLLVGPMYSRRILIRRSPISIQRIYRDFPTKS